MAHDVARRARRQRNLPLHAGRAALPLISVAARWALFAAVLVSTGSAAFHFLVSRRLARGGEASALFAAILDGGTARIAAAWTAVGVLAITARLPIQLVQLYDDTLPLFPQMQALAAHTMWGTVWMVQLVAGVVALLAWIVARNGGVLVWITAAVASLVLALTPSLSGHAIGSERLVALAVTADALHVIASGVWIGAMASLAGGLTLAMRHAEVGSEIPAGMVSAFSNSALVAAPLVLASGLFAAWLHLGTLAALWQSRYGLTLIVKVTAVAVLAAAGAWNWRRGTPQLRESGAVAPMRASVRVELIVAVVVLVATAVLAGTPQPGTE